MVSRRFDYEDIYFDTLGEGIKGHAALDVEAKNALATEPGAKNLGPGKVKTYNIISAFLLLLGLLFVLQIFK